eukprot:89906-Prorocentrum_minimum.AAC.1
MQMSASECTASVNIALSWVDSQRSRVSLLRLRVDSQHPRVSWLTDWGSTFRAKELRRDRVALWRDDRNTAEVETPKLRALRKGHRTREHSHVYVWNPMGSGGKLPKR